MPKITFTDTEATPLEIIKGDFPFEVVGVNFSISNSKGKTKGADVIELKVKAFSDETFETPKAQWTERLYLHESCAWVYDTFIKSSNLMIDGKPIAKGQAIDFTEELLLGLRGWMTCLPEQGTSDADKAEGRKYNRVKSWITNKPKLPRAPMEGF